MSEVKSQINQVFARHFEDWDSLSNLDPTKALAGSLTQVLQNARDLLQNERKSIIESFPGLVGFPRKRASAPTILLEGRTRSDCLERVELPESMQLEVSNPSLSLEHRLEIRVHSGQGLDPIRFFQMDSAESDVLIDIEYRSSLGEIRLYGQTEEYSNNEPIFFEVSRVEADGSAKLIDENLVKVINGLECQSDGPFQFGCIRIILPPSERGTRFRLRVVEGAKRKITWSINQVVAQIVQVSPRMGLGRLEPHPWSSVPLPIDILRIPTEVEVEVSRQSWKRIPVSQKTFKDDSSNRKKPYCRYEPSHHRITFPSAEKLLLGQVEPASVRGFEIETRPTTSQLSTISSEQTEILVGRYANFLDSMKFDGVLDSGCPAENLHTYFNRFYDGLNQFLSQSKRKQIDLRKLRNTILNRFDAINMVELSIDDSSRSLKVFVKTRSRNLGESKIYEKIEAVENLVPLDYRVLVIPFQKKDLDLYLRAEGLNTLAQERALFEISRSFRKWPDGRGVTGEALTLETLKSRLEALPDRLKILDLKLINLETGEFLTEVSFLEGVEFKVHTRFLESEERRRA